MATPSPTPVEPSRSRCKIESKISRAGRPETSAARSLISCSACFLPFTLRAARTASGLTSCDNDIFVPLFSARQFARPSTLVGIEPADRAVTAPVNNVHAPAAGMLEDNHRGAGEIEFGDGGGDRKGLQLFGSLRHDDGIVPLGRFFVLISRRLDKISNDLPISDAGGSGGAAPEARLIAAQATFN